MRHPLLLLACLIFSAAHADTRTDIGGTIVDGNLRNFYLAVGEYYRVPEREVIVIRERRIPDYEVPVVLYLAQRARVDPGVVVDLRLRGRSWMDITLHFGLGPDIYYVPVREVYGPPYGRAYGYYKNKPKHKWKTIVLADDDVVNLVNLRFISERYHYAPEQVMRLRSAGRDFPAINQELRQGKRDRGEADRGNADKAFRGGEDRGPEGKARGKGQEKKAKNKQKGDKD